jgi:Ca2+-binding EF-hand superfamily protein
MNSISSTGMAILPSMLGMHRADPTQVAQKLFSEIDSSGQGYIEISDLEAVYQSTNSDETDVSALFDQLDSDDDGKITQQEFTDSFVQMDEQIGNLVAQLRADEVAGMMPPPPPPPPESQGEDPDTGFTLEELTAQLEEIGSSDPKRAELISSIIENFDEADTDGDGKVSHAEAMSFNESTSANSDTASTTESSTEDINEKVLLQLTRLLEAYSSQQESTADSTATISVTV